MILAVHSLPQKQDSVFCPCIARSEHYGLFIADGLVSLPGLQSMGTSPRWVWLIVSHSTNTHLLRLACSTIVSRGDGASGAMATSNRRQEVVTFVTQTLLHHGLCMQVHQRLWGAGGRLP